MNLQLINFNGDKFNLLILKIKNNIYNLNQYFKNIKNMTTHQYTKIYLFTFY